MQFSGVTPSAVYAKNSTFAVYTKQNPNVSNPKHNAQTTVRIKMITIAIGSFSNRIISVSLLDKAKGNVYQQKKNNAHVWEAPLSRLNLNSKAQQMAGVIAISQY